MNRDRAFNFLSPRNFVYICFTLVHNDTTEISVFLFDLLQFVAAVLWSIFNHPIIVLSVMLKYTRLNLYCILGEFLEEIILWINSFVRCAVLPFRRHDLKCMLIWKELLHVYSNIMEIVMSWIQGKRSRCFFVFLLLILLLPVNVFVR